MVNYDLPLLLKTDCDSEPEFIFVKEDLSAIYIKKNRFSKSRQVVFVENFELEADFHDIDLTPFHKTTTEKEFTVNLAESLARIKV